MTEVSSRSTKQSLFSLLLAAGIFFLATCRPPQAFEPPHPPAAPHQPYDFIGKKAMVVAAHRLAAQAGLEILKDGGNAVDAAVAVSFALNAAEPFASGIGGGGFMVIYLAEDKKVTVINFREKAPALSSPAMFQKNEETIKEWRESHGLSVAVPGALAGWDYALRKYGTKELEDVIRPAIEIAEKGFAVSQTFSTINKDEYEKLLLNAGEKTRYLLDGLPYEPGDLFRNPELARTFRIIAKKGADEFYRGGIAQKIVMAIEKKGGILSPEDLFSYEPEEVSPLRGTYENFTLYTIPPPGSGGLHIIQLLNILEKWPVGRWGHNSPAYIHHFSEALRFVFSDRARYLGDPDFIPIPIARLISKSYAGRIVSLIRPDRILGEYPYSRFDEKQETKDNTSHLCVADGEGNLVSQTQSINHFFGSGIVPENCGFLLNNHMDDFSQDPESPNAPHSNRRPVSSMGPLILFKGKDPFLALGTPGGTRIFPTLTQILINIIEFGMSLDEAIEAPRFFTYSQDGKAKSIFFECRIPSKTIESLRKLGHSMEEREAYDTYFGGAQGILILQPQRILYGGADSRRDGYGAGY